MSALRPSALLLRIGLCTASACGHGTALPTSAPALEAAPPAGPVGVSVVLSTWDGQKESPVLATQKLPTGARFALSVAVTQDAYVALFLADTKGGMRQMYPKPFADQRVLPAKQWLRIPQTWFVLDQSVGLENFLLVSRGSKPERDGHLRELAQAAHQDNPQEELPLERSNPTRRRTMRQPPPPGLLMGVVEDAAETLVESSDATVVRLSIRHVRGRQE